MQGGDEPRGSGGPGRGVYLVRRAVFVLIAIVLFAFVLPRACGAFSGPDTNDSSVRESETERAQTPSGGSVGSSNGSSGDLSGNTIEVPSYPDEAASGSGGTAGTEEEDEPADSGSGDDDDEDATPSTVEETLALEEPENAEPYGIPTVAMSEQRARQAGGADRVRPTQDRIEATEITLALRSNPPERDMDPEPVRIASETIPVESPATTVFTSPEPGPTRNAPANVSVTPGSEREAQAAVRRAERVARAGNNVANASGDVADDGGNAATLADARRSLDDIAAGGGARDAVRGALRDARAAVSAAEGLDDAPDGKENERCKRNPQRCLGVSALLR